jgi:PPM family protein phosphatase
MTYTGVETAWAMVKGERIAQEDALHLHFDADNRSGYIIVADGMGGHTSGDIASSLAVEAVDEALHRLWTQKHSLEKDMRTHLPDILDSANARIASYIKTNPQTSGMGTTVLAVIILEGRLYWASVGDSPLYLLRNGRLMQLNEDHSMARQIDQMVHAGQLTAQAAREHPNRSALTSVVMGDVIADADCSALPYELVRGDILIASSDGVCSLSAKDLTGCILAPDQTADDSVAAITRMLEQRKDPTQDNLALCVVRIL